MTTVFEGSPKFGGISSVHTRVTTIKDFGAATPQPAGEAVPVALTYSQKLEALSLRFYQGMTWNPKAGDYYTTSRADLELYRVVEVEDGTVKTQYCDQRNTDAVASWPVEEFTSAGFGPKRVWVPDFVLSAHPPQPSVSVSCPAPTPDDETYYSKGKDANWLAALSDEDLAEAVCFAAQDLNDTGLGDDLDKWMPFQAMMSIAADRIKKLITAQPSVSDAQSALEAYGRSKVQEGMQRAVDLYPQGIAAILAEREKLK